MRLGTLHSSRIRAMAASVVNCLRHTIAVRAAILRTAGKLGVLGRIHFNDQVGQTACDNAAAALQLGSRQLIFLAYRLAGLLGATNILPVITSPVRQSGFSASAAASSFELFACSGG